MEFRQLTYFLAAAHTQNFRKAAELCLVTQPALSRQIAALESELGLKLFKREKQRVELTAAGQAFVAYAKETLDVLQRGEQELVRWQEGQKGVLLIGCNHSLAAAFLPSLLATFYKRYPEMRLKVLVSTSDRVVRMVERGEVDLGFIYDPSVRSDVVVVKELFRQPLQALVSTQHPFVQKAPTLSQILTEPLILLGEETRLRKVIERMCMQRGLEVQPAIEIGSVAGLKELIKQGCGVSLIPPALLWPPQETDGLTLLPVSDITESFTFALVYRRLGSLAVPARQFINTIIEQTAKLTSQLAP
ncbi:LysR family transcriptional activator of glutamate synthase operon/LysR family cyn operon transcriptional activator [Thermosporothrix hazakensis]|uniref:LysR family transcriptional activator of glutamate synthase operon/LysR family cyn operon transcriptional activator n=2 Tax=Thermosporothrix TaxID=768650 RepID=A0A326U859_THEHA|nr:LysR family transcriptional regulator [Thermosporothrix hazakensis]PZW29365.1 LysR family transcriptional activator of glutamate synthase operon/LysR family cyn operon transcriptional activator [Thermosporothrix hazakensis]BBH85650.1 LysR family transcriptional regulator [Thermosporothrix sp. COM3]GCE45921.1 LysR family transcriptional regulator [Thermosporothrix hazakensis]